MIYFLLITAFTVSVDSFVCGFSLSFSGKNKFWIVPVIATTVFIMCLFTNYFAKIFSSFLNERIASLGGLILIGVGIYNLLTCEKEAKQLKYSNFKQVLFTGFAVGLDGAIANLSLSIIGLNHFYVPVIIAVMHAFTITLGIFFAKLPKIKSLERLKFVPPIILILFGLYKLLFFFI